MRRWLCLSATVTALGACSDNLGTAESSGNANANQADADAFACTLSRDCAEVLAKTAGCATVACVVGRCVVTPLNEGAACASSTVCISGSCVAGACVLTPKQPYWDAIYNPFTDGTAAWASAALVRADGSIVLTGATQYIEPDLGFAYGVWTMAVAADGSKIWDKNAHWIDSPDVVQRPGGHDLTLLDNGDIAVAGSLYADAVVLVRNADGKLVWLKQYGDPKLEEDGVAIVAGATDLWLAGERKQGDVWHPLWFHLDRAGNVLAEIYQPTIAAGLRAQVPWQQGFAAGGVTSGGDVRHPWLARLDGQGKLLWQKALDIITKNGINSMATDAAGGLWLVGDQMTAPENRDGWLAHVDGEGNIVLQKTFGGQGADDLFAIARVPDAMPGGPGWILTGDVAQGHGYGDLWLIRTDTAGVPAWQRNYGGLEYDVGFTVAALLPANGGGGEGFVVAGASVSKVKALHGSKKYWPSAWYLRTSPLGDLRCDGGTLCTGANIPDCFDGNKCTQDLCNTATGGCVHPAVTPACP